MTEALQVYSLLVSHISTNSKFVELLVLTLGTTTVSNPFTSGMFVSGQIRIACFIRALRSVPVFRFSIVVVPHCSSSSLPKNLYSFHDKVVSGPCGLESRPAERHKALLG